MAYEPYENGEVAEVRAAFRQAFHRIVPADIRPWQWDCYHLDADINAFNFSLEVRVLFRPMHGVTPNDTLGLRFQLDDNNLRQTTVGFREIIRRHQHEVDDFIIKCMMVYSYEGPQR
jgi:hypothetical protein